MNKDQFIGRLYALVPQRGSVALDIIRDEMEQEADNRAKQTATISRDLVYYALNDTQLYRDVGGNEMRRILESYRIPPDQLSSFCKARGLDENSMKAVAMGERYSYKGWIQGDIRHSALGKKYQPPRDPDDEIEDSKPVKKFGLFHRPLVQTGNIKED